MVSEDNFEILDAAAWRAACKFNKDPQQQEDCYDYVLYNAALKVSEEHNASYMYMRCNSLARNWYAQEHNRHFSRCEADADPEELTTRNSEHKTPEEQLIEQEEIAEIKRLFAQVGLTDIEVRTITARAEGNIYFEEIAELEGRTPKAIFNAAYKARKKLKPALHEAASQKGYNTDSKSTIVKRGNRYAHRGIKRVDDYHPRRERSQKPAIVKICQYSKCAQPFETQNPRQKYCSDSHNTRSCEERHGIKGRYKKKES